MARQHEIATFTCNGHGVRVSQVEIGFPIVEERRYVVFWKEPGKPIRQWLYTGADAEGRAMGQFECSKAIIECNH
jgi:hypothetical protein